MLEIPKLDQANLERLTTELKVPFRVRFATTGDVAPLLALVNEAYWYENEGPRAFKKPEALRVNKDGLRKTVKNGTVLIAATPEDDKKILGSVEYRETSASPGSGSEQAINAYFAMLAVGEQGKGIGSELVSIVEAVGRFRGRNMMELRFVNHSNLAGFYRKLGYEVFERQEHNDPLTLIKPTHFILMRKTL